LDGAKAAQFWKERVAARVAELQRVTGQEPGLATVLVGRDPASERYVALKQRDATEVGIRWLARALDASAREAEIFRAVDQLNENPLCSGIIVQLPLPPGVNPLNVLERISPAKDADGLHPANLGRLVLDSSAFPLPCTALAVFELLNYYDLVWSGQNVAILGRGITAGRPLGLLLSRKGVDATVVNLHSRSRNIAEHLRAADIIVAAMGQAHFVTADLVRPGAIVVDVGVSRVLASDGKYRLTGDVDPRVAEVAAYLTPNPGGVGPMTRAMLLRNVVELAEAAISPRYPQAV
jgi:methylenetetrahydrofolate dehydrogenase (NADP+)/methenyltetrahydrofolate cyclohydrolase